MPGGMKPINFDSARAISNLLEQHSLQLKKRFGQNFLINSGARDKILTLLNSTPEDVVWEIGAGIGSMTSGLLQSGARVIAFEIDYGLARILESFYLESEKFVLIKGDFLKTCTQAVEQYGPPSLVVGNLPFSSAARMLIGLLGENISPKRIVCTLQREVADRLSASPGTKDYSFFSVICQMYWSIKQGGDLQAGSFFPKPRVVSSITLLTPLERHLSMPFEFLLNFVRILFRERRKTIRNNLFKGDALHLAKAEVERQLTSCGVQNTARAEELSIEDILALAKVFYNCIHSL